MYAAPAESPEAHDSSGQWLAVALGAALLAPNVLTGLITVFAMTRPNAAWMLDAMCVAPHLARSL
jgi:hypothetical protein